MDKNQMISLLNERQDLQKYLNKELYDINIRVVNMKETKFRANALNLIFTINSILPF